MKKNIFKYILIMSLGFTLFSCDKYDQDINYYDTVKLDLSTNNFTVLDSELSPTIDFVSESKVVTDVVVLVDGVTLDSGTATDNKFTFTVQRAVLGLDTIGSSARVYINATVDGKVKEMYTDITMETASSIKDPFVIEKDEDDEDIEKTDLIYELSDVVKNFTYKVAPETSTVGMVTASVKVGEKGTYLEQWSKTYDKDDLTIGIKGSDYNKNDTVFVELVAWVGAFSDTVKTSVVINEYLLGAVSSDTINVAEPGFDLVGDSIIDVAKSACSIQFTHDFSNLYQGITAVNGTELVLISDENLESEMNLPVLKDVFDAGVAVTVVDNVVVGDRFIVKSVRNSKDFYGILDVSSVNTIRTSSDDFIIFDASVEEYNEQQ